MHHLPPCPECQADFTYMEGVLCVCPSCAHEWSPAAAPSEEPASADDPADESVVRDANGNVLQNGDAVIVIKDLKLKGSSLVIKGGTKVKNIRLVEGDHNIDCKVDGIGAMSLKSEFVRKA